MAAHDGLHIHSWGLRLAKGARDRLGKDAVASRLALLALAQACGMAPDAATSLAAALDLLPAEVEHVQVITGQILS